MLDLTILGTAHALLASAGIVLGAVQLLRPKSGRSHRGIGYTYVGAMLVADGAALAVFQFTGHLNILHFGAVTSLGCVATGMAPVLRSPRRPGWREQHYLWIAWSYVGLLAAAATEFVVRTLPLGGSRQAWLATILVTAAVTGTGRLLIQRHRPFNGAPA